MNGRLLFVFLLGLCVGAVLCVFVTDTPDSGRELPQIISPGERHPAGALPKVWPAEAVKPLREAVSAELEILGSVIDQYGNPVADVQVHGQDTDGVFARARANAAGRFRLPSAKQINAVTLMVSGKGILPMWQCH